MKLKIEPRPNDSLKGWLETALACYILGGVSIPEIVEVWMKNPPYIPEKGDFLEALKNKSD